MGQKNTFFEKQTGEVAENKQKWSKNKPEQTGKQSGEVAENTCLWKKQSENKLETKRAMLLKTNKAAKRTDDEPEQFRREYTSLENTVPAKLG